MKRVLSKGILLSTLAAAVFGLGSPVPRAFAAGVEPWARLSPNLGSPEEYLVLWGQADTASFSATGSSPAAGYFLLPKTSLAKAEILNQGYALRIYIPSLGQLDSGVDDSAELKLPSGIGLLDPMNLQSRAELKIGPAFVSWLKGMDASQTTLNYYDGSLPHGVRSLNLSEVTADGLAKAVSANLHSDKQAFITIISKNRIFSNSDVQALAGAFSFRVNSLITDAVSQPVAYVYPSADVLTAVAGNSSEFFYQALDQLDAVVYPKFSASDVLQTIGGSTYAERFHRTFLEKALSHYFTSDSANAKGQACETGYSVHLNAVNASQSNLSDENAFSFSYFAPKYGEVEIALNIQISK